MKPKNTELLITTNFFILLSLGYLLKLIKKN
jgi:hypothetical protein